MVNIWLSRELSLSGKTLITKSLLIPKFLCISLLFISVPEIFFKQGQSNDFELFIEQKRESNQIVYNKFL